MPLSSDTALSSGTLLDSQGVMSQADGVGPGLEGQITLSTSLAAPTNLTATRSGADAVLSWNAVIGATGYDVLKDGGTVAIGTPTGTSFTDVAVGDAQHTYTVRPTQDGVQGTLSSSVTLPASITSGPTAPTNLTATRSGVDAVLSWTAATGATSYQVYRDGGSVAVATPTGTTFTDVNVGAAQHTYTVHGVNSAGVGPVSNTATLPAVSTPLPTAPTNLVATRSGSNGVLTWTAATGATSYRVYRDGGTTQIGSVTGSPFTDVGVGGAQHTYTVRGVNSAGLGPVSNTATLPATPGTTLAAPTNVTATRSGLDAVIGWSAVTSATSYQVYRDGAAVATTSNVSYVDSAVGVNQRSYTVAAVAGGTAGPQSAAAILPPDVDTQNESWVLDGLELNGAVGPLRMTAVSVVPPKQRADWIGSADSETQVLFRTPLHENREITMRVEVSQQASMDAAISFMQLVVDKLQKASKTPGGIGLVWIPAESARVATFDVLAGEITGLPVDWEGGWFAKSPSAEIRLVCAPYWRGAETLTRPVTSSAPVATLEVQNVSGDVPALGRLIITDVAGQARRHVEWGLEGPSTYNATTGLIVDSDQMVTAGFAGTQNTRTGAYDPNLSGANVVRASLVPTTIAVAGVGNLAHVGSFKVRARVWTNASDTVIRFTWGEGEGNVSITPFASTIHDTWTDVTLGTITIRRAVGGAQNWTGYLEAYSQLPTSASLIDVDHIMLIPLERFGQVRSVSPVGRVGTIVAYDEFAGSGVLNGRTAGTGGTWVTSGAPTDFVASPVTSGMFSRSAVSDSSPRVAVLGGAQSDMHVRAAVLAPVQPETAGTFRSGVVFRYVNATNYGYASIMHYRTSVSSSTYQLQIGKVVGGVNTDLLVKNVVAGSQSSLWTMDVDVFQSGRVTLVAEESITRGKFQLDATDSAFAAGGALQTGAGGLYDFNANTTGPERGWDSLYVTTRAGEDAAIFPNRTLEVRHDDTIRDNATGTFKGRPTFYRGSRFMVPPGTSRVAVRARRNDIELMGDDAVADPLQIQVAVTPRGLVLPGSPSPVSTGYGN